MIVIGFAHDAAYQAMADITRPTWERYCQKRGYAFYYEPDLNPVEADACKIRIFRDLYATGNYSGDDLFVWADCDALVMNSEVRIEDIAATWLGEGHYLIGHDANGINSGVWIARFTSHADHFLRVSWQLSLSMGFSDQPGLFQTMLQYPFKNWVRQCPGKVFNCFDYPLYGWDWPHGNEVNAYAPGDFVLHAAALEMPKRMAVLRHYAALAT